MTSAARSVSVVPDTVTEVMVNGPNAVFIERNGKAEPTDVWFREGMRFIEENRGLWDEDIGE